MSKTKKFVYLGLLIALNVVLTRFFSINTPIIQIGFGFLAVAFAAQLFGPLTAGIMAAAADILGSVLFPSSGAYFPGFTLSAFVGGVIYGLFIYNKKINMLNIFLAVVLINVFVNMGLNTIWLTMLTGKGFMAIIVPRVIKDLIMIPIQTVLVYMCCDRIVSLVKLKFAKQA